MSVTITINGTDYSVPSSASDTNWAANQVAWEQAVATYLNATGTTVAALTPSWTSLSSILVNSWAQLGGAYQVAGYWKDPRGFVNFRGSIHSGTAGTVAFTLPSGCRPSKTVVLVASADQGQAEVVITSAGVTTITNIDSSDPMARTSLDGLSFSTSA